LSANNLTLLKNEPRTSESGAFFIQKVHEPDLFYGVTRYIPFLMLLIALGACKKDLLPVRRVRQISTVTTDRLNRVQFLDDMTGICIGGERFDHSRILRTTNGGRSWASVTNAETSKEMFGIAQSSFGRVYLIGYDGKLLLSDDYGETWEFRQLRFENYKAIDMRNPQNPVAIGGVSFDRGDVMDLSSDANLLRHDSLDYELNDIRFAPAGHAYRCGYGTIQSSTDSGRTWNWAGFKNDNYSAIEVLENRVWVCGREGSIVRSLDGGRSWERLRNGTYIGEKKYRLNDIAFRNENEGFAVGEKGVVLYSRDAGAHWSELEPFTSSHLQGICIHPDGRIFICGENGALWELRF
jgi:photosystem II stability/assembly factor-like uncharacterized protein